MSEVVLVTGASSGIGEAIAHAFAERGKRLFLVARRGQRLAEVARTCRAIGSPEALFSIHDLSIQGQGGVLVTECLEKMGRLDYLICNAGYGVMGAIADVAPSEMARIWQVNFQSAYESIYASLPHLLARGSGHIVLVSSIIGKKAMPFTGAYSATKFAQIGLGESLWAELKDSGVGVTVVCPGYTASEFHQASITKGNRRQGKRPFKGQPAQHVAQAVLKAVNRGRREIHLTWPGKLILGLDRLSNTLSSQLMAYLGHKDKGPASVAERAPSGK